MAANLQNPAFTNEDKAREALEAMRWPNGPVCPHCGSVDGIAKAQGKATRPGLYYCSACNDQFTVTVGTLYDMRASAALPADRGDGRTETRCPFVRGFR